MKQSKHFVHFALLFSFLTLAVSGLMAYFLPFSLLIARLHILFAVFTIILIAYHLYQRYQYFFNTLSRRNILTMKTLILAALLWFFFWLVSINNLQPAAFFMNNSFEAIHQKEILRTSPHSATIITKDLIQTVRATPPQPQQKQLMAQTTAITLEMRFPEVEKLKPAIAIWAESTTGALIETLYLSPELAFSEQPIWHGKQVSRHHILPVWRNRFTLMSGIEPSGKIDALSGATAKHQFNLEKYFLNNEDEYLLFIEINLPFDINESWQDQHLGQPSVLYSAYIDHSKYRVNALLELTGHGGSDQDLGKIQYDLSSISSAQNLVDLVLASSFNIKQTQQTTIPLSEK
ncbi:MAG: hypothetical protein ACSHW0_15465 [Thalassotalea sp.]